jgi:hypothetical protein
VEELTALTKKWIPFCLVCLKTFSNERNVVLMECGHVVCETCSSSILNLECPIHKTLMTSFVGICFVLKVLEKRYLSLTSELKTEKIEFLLQNLLTRT